MSSVKANLAALLGIVCVLNFVTGTRAQDSTDALALDRLERKAIQSGEQERLEVGFSATLEGTVSGPQRVVFVTVHEPRLQGWRLFRAVVDREPDATGRFRWRAIVYFGKQDGTGVGDPYRVRARVFDPAALTQGLPAVLAEGLVQSRVLVLNRVR